MAELGTGNSASRSGKTGVVIVLVALVAVLVVAFLAYDALAGKAGGSAGGAAAGDAAAPGAVESAGGGAAAASAGGADAMRLSDYDATVYTETGEPYTFAEIANGKPLIINFWATWCPYCVQEMPDFQEIYAQYGDRVAFAFVDYADGSRETVSGAAAWLEDNGFTDLPAYYDTKVEAVSAFGIAAFPTTIVVAADGEVVDVKRGAIDADLLRGVLATLV